MAQPAGPTRHRVYGVAVAWLILACLAWLLPLVLAGRSLSIPGISVVVVEQGNAGTFSDQAFRVALLLAASLFSWLLAAHALRAGWAEGLLAAAVFDLGAVVLGSFIVAGLASVEPGLGPIEIIASTLGLGLVGLLILGIPMLVLGMPLTVAWMVLLRVLVRLTDRVSTPSRA